MNWLDVLFAVILAWSVIQGFWRGFARLAISLISTVVGILAGIWFYGIPASFLLDYLKSEALCRFLGFVIVFLLVRIAGALIGWLASKVVKFAGLSWLDRLLGGAFGVLRAALVGMAIVLGLTAFPFHPLDKTIAQSRAVPYLLEGARIITAVAPRELKDGFEKSYEELHRIWKGTVSQGDKSSV